MQTRLIRLCFLVLAACLAGPVAWGTPIYQVVDLGTLPNGSSSASAISHTGIMVGWATNAGGDFRAVVNHGGGLQDLGVAPEGWGGMANAVNNYGHAAGMTYSMNGATATVWRNGTATALGTLGGMLSYATGINDAGIITGLAETADGSGHAFTYQNGVMSDIGAGSGWSAGYGINSSGTIVGTRETSPGAFRAFAWSSGGGLRDLGTLGGWYSYGMAINDSGAVAGHSQVGQGYMHAFVTVGGVMVDLGTLGGGNSYGYGVNGYGDVVGYSDTGSGSSAFVWTDGVMYDLNVLLGGSGWQLDAAYGINDAGQIVGSGTYDGVSRAFRLDPVGAGQSFGPLVGVSQVPEPNTLLLLLTAGLVGALSQIRRAR